MDYRENHAVPKLRCGRQTAALIIMNGKHLALLGSNRSTTGRVLERIRRRKGLYSLPSPIGSHNCQCAWGVCGEVSLGGMV